MAVMLTQWSPVPWSGETVSRPSLPPPAEGTAPTPIYETLVREWSRAGRTVPRQAAGRGGHDGESGDGGGLRWWRADEGAHRSHDAPAPAPVPAGRDASPYGPGHGDGFAGRGPEPADAAEAEPETDAAPAPAPGSAPAPAPKPPVWERVAIL